MHNIPTHIFYSLYITVCTFSQVKNKPHEGVTNVRLFLGLLAQIQTTISQENIIFQSFLFAAWQQKAEKYL
jgi:hypothetical protein